MYVGTGLPEEYSKITDYTNIFTDYSSVSILGRHVQIGSFMFSILACLVL